MFSKVADTIFFLRISIIYIYLYKNRRRFVKLNFRCRSIESAHANKILWISLKLTDRMAKIANCKFTIIFIRKPNVKNWWIHGLAMAHSIALTTSSPFWAIASAFFPYCNHWRSHKKSAFLMQWTIKLNRNPI